MSGSRKTTVEMIMEELERQNSMEKERYRMQYKTPTKITTCYQNGVYFVETGNIFRADIFECVRPDDEQGYWFQSLSNKKTRKNNPKDLVLCKVQRGDVFTSKKFPFGTVEVEEIHYAKNMDTFYVLILDTSLKFTIKDLINNYEIKS